MFFAVEIPVLGDELPYINSTYKRMNGCCYPVVAEKYLCMVY